MTVSVQMPTKDRNYCLFNQAKVNYFVNKGEKSLPALENILNNSKDEKEVVETLYIVDRMIDNGVKGVDKMYPA